MKLLVCFLALMGVSCALVDLGDVRRRDIRIPLPFGEHIQREPRIVGGQEAVANSIPYQVALLIYTAGGIYFCGGSILDAGTILTAAHCVQGATQVEVIAGAHSPLQPEANQQIRFTSSFVIHTGWSLVTLRNDIALVDLPLPLVLNDYVQPVDLPPRSQIGNTFAGQRAIVSGWGLESDSATSISQVLRWVEVEIIINLLCNILFLGVIQGSHICSSGSGGRGPCSGDSGGPLVLTEGNQTVGIVSFGIGLGCEIGWPTVFTRVTVFLDWIQMNSNVVISP